MSDLCWRSRGSWQNSAVDLRLDTSLSPETCDKYFLAGGPPNLTVVTVVCDTAEKLKVTFILEVDMIQLQWPCELTASGRASVDSCDDLMSSIRSHR
jgi:hypothetical protein